MTRINAVSLTYHVKDWMTNSSQPRILHVFDNACNLINDQKKILSIVSPQIGNGPFNLVLGEELLFSEHLRLESPISVFPTQLNLGNLTVNIGDAKLWNPRPNWEVLHAKREDILNLIPLLRVNGSEQNNLQFSSSLASANISTATKLASRLAGLGQGLTPAGDDFIMGAIYAAWIIHPPEVAGKLGEEIAKSAAPLTTSLSAAWIRSAGRGEAGELWHHLFNALISGDNVSIQQSVANILAVGETSGADALSGFVSVCSAAKERMYN